MPIDRSQTTAQAGDSDAIEEDENLPMRGLPDMQGQDDIVARLWRDWRQTSVSLILIMSVEILVVILMDTFANAITMRV